MGPAFNQPAIHTVTVGLSVLVPSSLTISHALAGTRCCQLASSLSSLSCLRLSCSSSEHHTNRPLGSSALLHDPTSPQQALRPSAAAIQHGKLSNVCATGSNRLRPVIVGLPLTVLVSINRPETTWRSAFHRHTGDSPPG